MTVALTVTGFSEYPHPLTADDFLALDVDPRLHLELIDGELILAPSPLPWHQEIILYKEAGLEYWRMERNGDELVIYRVDGSVSRGSHEGELDGGLRIRIDLVELATWLPNAR